MKPNQRIILGNWIVLAAIVCVMAVAGCSILFGIGCLLVTLYDCLLQAGLTHKTILTGMAGFTSVACAVFACTSVITNWSSGLSWRGKE